MRLSKEEHRMLSDAVCAANAAYERVLERHGIDISYYPIDVIVRCLSVDELAELQRITYEHMDRKL